MGKRHRGSDDSLMVTSMCDVRHCETSQIRTPTKQLHVGIYESPSVSSESPVKKLFVIADTVSRRDSKAVKSAQLRSCNSKCTNCIDLSDTVQVDSTSCGVHHDLLDARVTDLDDDDVENGMTDDDWCSSDKENDVFPFHHTASVIAMERIFAKQRLPNFVRPKGYISPLRHPTLLRSAPVPSHPSVMTTP